MKTIFLIFLCLVSINFLFAQQVPVASPWRFNSMINVGLLNGETGSAFQLQTINGIRKGSWLGGVGLGIDYYKIRSIPLFLDIRKEFGKSANKLFIYTDAGINFGWATDGEKQYNSDSEQFGNGFYTDLGLGYTVHIARSNHLMVSMGYSYKKITETTKLYYPIPMYYNTSGAQPQNIDPTSHINYYMNRLSIKLGWEF